MIQGKIDKKSNFWLNEVATKYIDNKYSSGRRPK